MIYKVPYAWILILVISCALVSAQSITSQSFTQELNIKFTQSELRSIERGVQMINSADQLLASAQGMYETLSSLEKKENISGDYISAFKKLMEASEMYQQGHMTIFSMFKAKSEDFWNSMRREQRYAAGIEKGRYYESQARKNMAYARQRREQALFSGRFNYAEAKMKEAYELEQTFIQQQGRALQVFIDYPVEYNYGWDNDITLDEITALYRNPAIKEPPIDIFATVDETIEVEPKLLEDILFKVQIAAHTIPITEEYIRTIYKGTLPIDMIFEDGWYKYSIGRYNSFEEAHITLEASRVSKAFIVAYKGGKRLTIKEAVEYLQSNQ